jgi:hypothetical protein
MLGIGYAIISLSSGHKVIINTNHHICINEMLCFPLDKQCTIDTTSFRRDASFMKKDSLLYFSFGTQGLERKGA